ncbi:Integrase catalytic domain-containing protein [Citrus sinensis]|uniref:Integrase catalytic domain-containing protein n=1 Tax=Citrus sinensis TaxID=2711 RepID=A0ACB8KGM1_CITSI|nr:Integrase catalytic domain-containing protein [Citrus sinensis]
MVEGETSRIGERSTETISGDTSGGRRDLSNRYSAPIIGGQKIDVEKFDGKINFGMWRREVMDALIQIDLDVVLKNKRHLYDEEIWDRMNEKACGQIRSCLTKEVKYLVKDEECAVTLWCTLEEKYLVKSPENRLHAMSQVYGFRMKSGVSMHDHVSRFEKLLADLKNLDEDIKDEVKAMILLHSLPEEYSHFVTTLIYGKSVIVFKDVCTALTSLEIRNNDKNSERASSEALVSKDWAKEKQKKRGGKNSRSKSRSRNIARDECAFCHEKGHWRKDCPKAQKRDGKKPAAANMARKDEGSDYSLSITPAAYVASSSEWILDTGATYHLELKEVRFVPALKKNLISVGALEAKGYKVTIEDGIMKFTHGVMVILQGVRRHNLYYLKGGTTDEANVVEAHSDTTKLWHVRLGHAGEKSLQTLMRHGLLKGTKTCKLNFCEHCVVGKKTRVKFGTTNHNTREILEYVHSDVWGPTKTASIGGSHYFVTFVDDFSRRVWVYTMRAKDENEGIKRHFTVRHTPQQNGVAERMNRTLLEKVRYMLSNAGLDKKFWAKAVSYASHLVNRLPSAAIGGKTPMEMWSGKYAQDYDSLRVFGCPAYYHVKDGKLDPRARKVIFVGFKGGVKGFKLWDLEDKKFVCSRDVTFDEASMMKASSSQQVENKTKEVLQRVEFDATPYVPVSSISKNGSTMEVTPRVEEEVVSSDVPQNEETIDDVDNDDFIATRRPRREIKKPGWLTKDMVVAYALPVIDDDIPNTFGEALRSSESDQWKLAMEEEMKSLHQNQTWELVKLPKGKRVIGNKWVYTKKQGSPNQTTPRYKARLVAKGFAQKEGIDYNEVFSPVVKHTSIRILLVLVAEYELELAQLDVKMAFLHGDLEEEIYMIQPCGFRVAGKENHVCRLIKSLYGLKQSPRQWYKRFDQFIQGQKFTRSEHDHCVYFRRLLDGAFIYLLLYVDDMLIASKNGDEIKRLKKQLASEFEMKDLGDAQRILGMEIRRDKKNGSVWLTQKSYLKKVLERFGMDDKTKPVCTRLAPYFKLSSSSYPRSQEERDYMARVPYASAVGSLMYAMVCTRPDISQAVSMVSRYMHNPGKNQWLAVKWILRYLYGTVDVGLLFKKDCGQQCVGYCDSDFAGDLDKRRSTTGYVFTLGGGPVSWRSILQSTIALSTTEAEYMAATEAVKEAIWLKGLLGDLGVIQENIAVFCDNQSAIFLAKNQTYHARTKHIDVKYHYVREIIESGVVLLRKIDTKDNPSDMLTKVENFSKLDKGRQESQVFCAGNQKWKIELHPMGTGVGAGDHLSLFLALGDSTVESVKVYAEFTLRILDQVGAKHRSFQAKYWFRRPSDGWGWPRFVSLSKLNEPGTGFLVNDACVVEAEVTVLGIFKPL